MLEKLNSDKHSGLLVPIVSFFLTHQALLLHNTMLERLASYEHTSLLGPVVSYEEKGFVKTVWFVICPTV
jgi:hypothetical protein